jgi:hypothetical protein
MDANTCIYMVATIVLEGTVPGNIQPRRHKHLHAGTEKPVTMHIRACLFNPMDYII